MFQLRSADSPDTETYDLSLPSGAQLEATEGGGAQVTSGEEVLLSVPAPSAIDATGVSVPVTLEVTKSSLEVTVEPGAEAQLPILVDPLFQTYEWMAKNTSAGICSSSIPPGAFEECQKHEEWAYDYFSHYSGHMQVGSHSFDTKAVPGLAGHAEQQQISGDHATIRYAVPRYFKEAPAPTSYIRSVKFANITWEALGQSQSPYLYMGIWDPADNHWVQNYSHTGQVEHGVNEPICRAASISSNFLTKIQSATSRLPGSQRSRSTTSPRPWR